MTCIIPPFWAVVGVCFGYVNHVLGLLGEGRVLERLVVRRECGL